MNKLGVIGIATLLVVACSRPHQTTSERNASERTSVQAARVTRRPPPTLDPRSKEAAEELVRGFARLVRNGNLQDAYMLLGPDAQSRKSFEGHFTQLRDLDVEVHAASDEEGAAGSTYVSVPLTIAGSRNGERVTRTAKALLRRVNDVPGSTEAQRHWHIERIDWNG